MQGIGIIGAGNISAAYLKLAPLFKGLEVRAIADLSHDAAKARAAEFGVKALSVDDLLAAKDIDIVVNLTIPDAHYPVTKRILEAGKHAYSEKPFVLSLEQGEDLRAICKARGLRIGSAPDTFLGGAHQAARAAIDEGRVGKIVAGTAHVLNHGMEHWHPNPTFFFLPGAGPMLDLGPYYVTNLIQLLGPVRRVAALANASLPERMVTAAGPMQGKTVPVKTPTNIHALLDFHSGATITLSTSWDIWAHRHAHMELYGTEGSIYLPDPNFFGGKVEVTGRGPAASEVGFADHPFGVPNHDSSQGKVANYRTAGLADMAMAIQEDRPHRCSMELALHAVDVMTACLTSGESGQFVTLTTTCERPAALSAEQASALLK
jgi:predicted dehydrogenase